MQTIDGSGTGHDTGFVKDSDMQNFVTDVIEASKQLPVIVDFWASWCEPCKQLGPALEKVVNEAGGAVRMVKVNVEENKSLAGQLGVQSIPAVFAFRDGQIVDGFVGALPESEIKSFVEKQGGPAVAAEGSAAAMLEAAKLSLEQGDLTTAVQTFASVLQKDEQNFDALVGLATIYLQMDETEQAQKMLDLVPDDKKGDPVLKPLLAQIELALKSDDLGEIGELSAQLEKKPDDLQIRFDLALALNGAGDREDAVHHLIEIVRRNNGWNEGAARLQLLQFFEAWGATDPMTIEGRRQLSLVLFA